MQNSFAMVRPEFHLAGIVARSTRDAVDDFETGPYRSEVGDGVGACAWVPGPPYVVGVADDIGAVARAHQLFGCLSLPLADMNGQAAAAEWGAAATWTRAAGSHFWSVPYLTRVK